MGSVVGQLARLHGCRAVGIAGGRAKCDYVVGELGFDACIDYKAGHLADDLRAACPQGVDVCFENVGGAVLDTVLRQVNRYGRVVICGLIAEYSATEPYGYKSLRSVLVNRIRMQGMIVFDWKDRYPEARNALVELRRAGTVEVSRIGGQRARQRAARVHGPSEGREPRQAARAAHRLTRVRR